MGGPYRERMIVPAYIESFFSYLRRRCALGRGIQGVLFVTVIVPSLLALAGVALARLGSKRAETTAEKTSVDPLGRPWGFVVSRARVEPRTGPVPALAPRPTSADTPISPEKLMAAIETQAGKSLLACYTRALEDDDALAGELVASLLVRRDGSAEVAAGGPRPLRAALGSCVERAIHGVKFGVPADAVWVHVPLRFDAK